MTPRDVQYYEAQALNVVRRWEDGEGGLEDEIAAALRAEGKAALEQAAQVCRSMAERSRMTNPAAFDELLTADMQIRALIAPAPESPSDSGEREVCGAPFELKLCLERPGHSGPGHCYTFVPKHEWVVLPLSFAQDILAALESRERGAVEERIALATKLRERSAQAKRSYGH